MELSKLNKSTKVLSIAVSLTLMAGLSAQATGHNNDLKTKKIYDITKKHWAYDSVKKVVKNYKVMDPEYPRLFMGEEYITREELAEVFHRTISKLEDFVDHDLSIKMNNKKVALNDIERNQSYIDEVVNKYGIMQPLEIGYFKGDKRVKRYEIAYDLSRYMDLLNTNIGETVVASNQNNESLNDLPREYWKKDFVKNVVNEYPIMEGYPDNTFRGEEYLTRYETASILNNFIRLVDSNFVPKMTEKNPTPLKVVRTVEMQPIVIEKVIYKQRMSEPRPLKAFDFKIGSDLRGSFASRTEKINNDPGVVGVPTASLDFWLPEKIQGQRIGLGVNSDVAVFAPEFGDGNGMDTRTSINSTVNWRVLGEDKLNTLGLDLGLGYNYTNFQSADNHGATLETNLDLPVNKYFGMFADNRLTYYPLNSSDQMNLRNDVFAGVNVPTIENVDVQLGYAHTVFGLNGSETIYGDNGARLNIRTIF